MLAAPASIADLRFPLYGSAKIDGLRCLAMGGRAMSRSMKPLPNRHLQAQFAQYADLLEGLDGEIVVGDPAAPDVYRTTSSAIMSADGEPDFRFLVFDLWNHPGTYQRRQVSLGLWTTEAPPPFVEIIPQKFLRDVEALDAFESMLLDHGYEGVMLRSPDGPYKQNRSTVREGYLLKVKRFEDAEAEIVGFEEEMQNTNEKVRDERGLAKRSTHKAGKVGKGTMGKLIVRGLPGTRFAGVEFSLGMAVDQKECDRLWSIRDSLIGQISTYRFFPIGCKDKPRHPQHHAIRSRLDMAA
jgi:DNA ligase-1